MNKINIIGSDKESVIFNEPVTASLILSFTVDIIFYEQILIRRFMKCGSSNNILLADEGQILQSEDSQVYYLQPDRYDYLIQPVSIGNIFHPKAFWINKESESLLLIGSGNVGFGGLSDNLEIFSIYSSSHQEDRSVMASFSQYVKDLISITGIEDFTSDKVTGLFDQDWIETSSKSSSNTFLFHNLTTAIFDQLLERIATPEIIHIIAPFYDSDLRFIHTISDHFQLPARVYFQEAYTTFPKNRPTDSIQPYSYVHPQLRHGNLHAKIMIFEHKDTFDILFGSPNATSAAMIHTAGEGNSELAVLQTGLSNKLLSNYLPTKPKSANIEAIHFETKDEKTTQQAVLKTSFLSRTNTLVIHTSNDLDLDTIQSIMTDTEKFKLPSKRISFEAGIINIQWPYQKIAPNWVFVTFKDNISNKILVFNHQKTVSSIDKDVSKKINSLQSFLSDKSLSELAYITSVLPIYSLTTQNYSRQVESSNTTKNEMEEIESTEEKEVVDYYVRVHDINLPNGKSISIQSKDTTLDSLLKVLKKVDKYSSAIIYTEPNKTLTLDMGEDNEANNLTSRQTQDYKQFLIKFTKEVKVMSRVNVDTLIQSDTNYSYIEYVINATQKMLLFLYLTSGISVQLGTGGSETVQLMDYQFYQLINPVLEIIHKWWKASQNHADLFENKRMHLFLVQNWVTSAFILGLIHSSYQQKYKDTPDVNYHMYSYEIVNSIKLLTSSISSLNIDTPTLEDEIADANQPFMTKSWQRFGYATSYREILNTFYKISSGQNFDQSKPNQTLTQPKDLASTNLVDLLKGNN